MTNRASSRIVRVRAALVGAGAGLLLFVLYSSMNRFAQQSELAELLYVLSGFGIVIPGILASWLNWNLFGIFSVAYGALVGWLYTVFQRRRKLFILAMSFVHFAGLALIDLAWRFLPSPLFWGR